VSTTIDVYMTYNNFELLIYIRVLLRTAAFPILSGHLTITMH